MTNENAGPSDATEPPGAAEPKGWTEAPDRTEAAALVSEVRRLRRSARSARHAYWFPLVLFGLLTCAALPFYVLPRVKAAGGTSQTIRIGRPAMPVLGGMNGLLADNNLGYYWLPALLGGLVLTMLWYWRHARQVGLVTSARGYVLTIAVCTALAVVLPLVGAPSIVWLNDLTGRGTFPFLIIAAGLWVLARAERSRGLAVITAVYTATALLVSLYSIANVLYGLGWNPTSSQWRLADLPNVLLPALVLLVSGAGAQVAQRRQRAHA